MAETINEVCVDRKDDDDNHIVVDEGDPEEMEYEIRFKDKPHPFCIPAIVQDVLDYLPTVDLENVRRVSHLWNEEACKILRKKLVVEIHNSERLTTYINCYDKTVFTTNFPHAAYQLWMDDISDNDAKMKRFFELFGSYIKSLDFHQLYLDGEVLFDILSQKVPYLESLSILNVPRRLVPTATHRRNIQVRFPKLKTVNLIRFPLDNSRARAFLSDLFSSVPNLETITIAKNVSESNGNTTTNAAAEPTDQQQQPLGTFVAEMLMNCPEPLNHLMSIGFSFRLKEAHIEPMTRKRFPLDNLEINVDPSVKLRSFASLMSVLSLNLRTLDISFNGNCTLISTLSPQHLQNITSLTLKNFNESLNFIGRMPQLKNLTLHGVDLMSILPVRGFQSLTEGHQLSSFKSTGNASDRDVVARIIWCFPNLITLHLTKLGDEGLGTIYRGLPFLQELVLTDGTFTDSGISGVPAEVCNDLWETMTIFDVNPERFRRDLFIGSLPHLRVAKLDSPAMTDLAVMFGLVGCTKLHTLVLKSNKITDISMPTIGEMRDSLMLLDVVACPDITEAGNFILKQKLEGRRIIFEPPQTSTRRLRRIRASEIHEREIERLGMHRDREMELRVALRLFNQLQHIDMEPGAGPGLHHHHRHPFVRQVLRRHAQGDPHGHRLLPADIAQLLDIVHLDEMNMDHGGGNIDAVGDAGGAAAAVADNNLNDIEHMEGAVGGLDDGGIVPDDLDPGNMEQEQVDEEDRLQNLMAAFHRRLDGMDPAGRWDFPLLPQHPDEVAMILAPREPSPDEEEGIPPTPPPFV